ncbi:MAG: hypothetical protein CMJ80_17255 [Planctomycetaceae bacterium]|nr:hypothetical protein [Planctomycetaceae bacterium]
MTSDVKTVDRRRSNQQDAKACMPCYPALNRGAKSLKMTIALSWFAHRLSNAVVEPTSTTEYTKLTRLPPSVGTPLKAKMVPVESIDSPRTIRACDEIPWSIDFGCHEPTTT